jgi:hypothetical protein
VNHPYASEEYANSFVDGAQPVRLDGPGLWVLQREILDTGERDATGCYPVAPIDRTADWAAGFQQLRELGLASLVLVTDVMTQPTETALREIFDPVVPFKTHYLVDLDGGYPGATKHHRYEMRRAGRSCETRLIDLAEHLDAWWALYQELVRRHRITGLLAFSRSYFEALARLQGLVTVGAFAEEGLVSAHLWVRHEALVYSHMAASSEAGYAIGAAYAVHGHALRLFGESGATTADLGGTRRSKDADDGLAAFKRGFANRSVRNWLCGRILDAKRYQALCDRLGRASDFFPAYRGE